MCYSNNKDIEASMLKRVTAPKLQFTIKSINFNYQSARKAISRNYFTWKL